MRQHRIKQKRPRQQLGCTTPKSEYAMEAKTIKPMSLDEFEALLDEMSACQHATCVGCEQAEFCKVAEANDDSNN